jgi:ribosomal protein L39E
MYHKNKTITSKMAGRSNGRQMLGNKQRIMLQVKQHDTVPKVKAVTTQFDYTLCSYSALIRMRHYQE